MLSKSYKEDTLNINIAQSFGHVQNKKFNLHIWHMKIHKPELRHFQTKRIK